MSRFSMDWSELSLQVMITFGHFLWQACVVGVVLLVVQHVGESLRDSRSLLRLRRDDVSLGETGLRGANIRYTVACVAFFSLPICVIATFAWVHQSRGPIMLVASDPVESPSTPAVSENEAIPTMANTGIPVLPPSATPMNSGVPVTKPIEPPTLVVEPQTTPVKRIGAFAPYLLLAYIVGVGFMLARFLLSIIGSSRLRQTIQPITDVKLLKTIAEQCARVGLKRVPLVALCQRVSVPVVVGIVKPMILLPPALLCGLDPNQIAAILSHELAHIRRYDLIVNLLQRFVEALLFFHPVTWWISRRVSIERENCCDDVAAACMGRFPYAGALLQMAELCIGNEGRRSAALATLAATGSNSTDFGYRIRRLIGAEETTRVGFTRRSISIGLALVSLLTVSLVAWGQSQKSEKKDAEVDIQWSRFGDENGLLSGARLILPKDGLKPREPLVVEYRLANVSKETKTLKCYLNKGMQFTSLNHGNWIGCWGPDWQREPVTLTIEPGDTFIDAQHLVSIDTTGLEPGNYHVAPGSAFGYPDELEPNTTHEIPHRGSIQFTIVGESTLKISELPKSDIHWGAPIAGLQVGAKIVGDPNAIAIGESVEADLFVANVTSQPIECSVAGPHISHGWLFSVMDSNGSAINLDGPFPLVQSPFQERRVIPFTLAPGEVSPITVDGYPLRLRPSFATSRTTQRYLTWPSGTDLAGSTTWPKHSIYSLMTQGGSYSATFHVTLMRPELPNLRLELDSGNVPFSVGLQENKPIDIFGTSDLKDEDVAAFVDKTLTKPYRPNLGRGSWQLGAHEYSIILTLESIPQQQMVADALMKKIEFSFGSDDSHARRLAMDYCAQNFPDRLLPYLVRRLSATDFPEPDLSTSGQAFPSYYELTVLGDLGEQGKAAIPALMKHLSAGDPIAREATIRSLVRVGPSDPEVMQSLSKCFNDSNVRVQGTAVYQAGRYGELAKPLGPKFVELLEAKSKEVQFWAAAALITSKFNPDLGFERLLAGAKSGERKDRRQALTTLAMLGSRSLAITPELRSMLNDTDPEVVGEVRETIRRIETNDRIVTHAEEAVQKAAARELVSVVAENPANRQTAGALKGRVTVDGVVPLLPKLRVPPPKSPRLTKRPTDEELRKFEASLVEIDDESIQVNADQGLANAFVYLAKVPSNWQPTQEDLKPFTLTIQDYRFEPRAAIVRKGQDVRLNNSSIGDDNFAFEPMKNDGQNRAVEAGSEITLKHPFTIPERTPVQAKSHIHPWKAAFLLPLDHPFAAITDKQGRFSIEGLPPGEHSFLVWHERTGWLEKSFVVNIEAGQTTEVNRSYSVDRLRLAANLNPSNDTPIDILWGESVGGMRLGIRRSEFARRRSPIRHGEHIDYEVWIKNETDEIVQIARDPRDVYSPRLIDDQSINVVGWSTGMSFMIPPEELAKAELILSPGQAAHRFPMPNHSASIRPPGSPRGRYGSEPLLLELGKYPVYAQFGELKSGVEEVEIIPEARLQIRKASRVTEKKREYAAEDPSEAILAWQSGDGEKHEAMVNWGHGIFVDERDLVSMEIVPVDGEHDQYSILLRLRPESATWLARQIKMYSLWDDPDLVAILLDGKPLMAPRLDASKPISQIMIDGKLSQVAASSLVLTLQSLISKPIESKTTASDNNTQSSEEKPDSSKQSFKLIDGETGKPLQGLKCRAIFAKLNTPPRYQACTTDEHGVVEVDVAKDESAGIAEVPSGWFSNGFGPVYVVVVPESEQQPQQNAEKKNEEPKLLKLWRGTEVDGRLLWSDKSPAAGVRLTAGVYINHQSWKEKLGMDLTHYSFDHGDWPNWSRTIVTDDDGKFRVTVPPKDARFWLRIGTTQLGFGPQINVGENETITQRLAKCVPLEIQYGGSSRSNMLIVHDIPETDDLVLHAGDLQLETGVIVRGRVVDAEGNGLPNVHLTSTGPHGPHSGRSATSGEDGQFEFPAMAAGNLTVHPDARLRDVTKPIHEQVISRDVQAVFVDQSFAIPSVFLPHEIVVRAVPHTEVTFEWVDRREDKTLPIAFYGAFRVRGYMPDENGKPATYWTSETERVERNGKQCLTVKIPTQLLKPDLMLAADSKVTASYSDSTGVTSGPGIVELGDITANTTRTIFGDEPLQPESPQAKKKEQSPSKSESAVRRRVHDLGGTMEVRERNGDAEEVRLTLMSTDKLASDEDLNLFATLKNLTRLEFRADHITSQGLVHISLMTNLENLHLWDCGLSDDDVGKLTNLKQLQWLGLYNCRNVTDRSSQHLLQLPKLHSLNLYGTPITVSFLQAIQGPRIRFLDLRRTGINAKDLSVIEKFPNLRQFNLPDEVTDADLSHLSGLSELKILTLQDINISDKGLLHLKALAKVETLYLRNTQITDEGLSHILDMQNLETLDLSGTQISSAGLLPLATLPKLQNLDLQRTQVDDDALKQLAQFSRLQFLDVQETNTTEAAVTALRNARPKMEIQWSN